MTATRLACTLMLCSLWLGACTPSLQQARPALPEAAAGARLVMQLNAHAAQCPQPLAASTCPGLSLGSGVIRFEHRQAALYYERSSPLTLLQGQRMQKSHFQQTGAWLPVLRLNSAQAGPRFAFEQAEQLYNGYLVADRLNAWVADTRSGCPDGSPSYDCNGVLVRATGYGDAYHSWNPAPSGEPTNMVSFTYLRDDFRTRATFDSQGLVMRPLGYASGYRLQVRCLFVTDGSTGSSTNDNCVRREPCFPQYDTPQKWIAKYTGEARSCAMFPNQQGVDFISAVRQHPDFRDLPYGYSEFVLAYWPQDIGRSLPLEAFFYSTRSIKPGDGREGARFIQRDLLASEGEYRPVVGLHLGSKRQPFSYALEDQALH